METLIVPRARFRLIDFLDALHTFSLSHGGDGDPLPVAVGDLVYHDPVELAEALTDDGEEIAEIPGTSLARLEAGLTLFGTFAGFDGFGGLNCANGKQIKLRVSDDDGDECLSFGVIVTLVKDEVEIEGRKLTDVSGECELEPLVPPNRVSGAMRRWVRGFVTRG